MPGALIASLRDRCRTVAERARCVRIDAAAVPAYAASLALHRATAAGPGALLADPVQRERQAAYWLTLDAINFGSGWFPTLRKHGRTGYRTIAAGVDRRFTERGPWNADELAGMTAGELADWLGQDPDHELVRLFVASLRDLGAHLLVASGGSFSGMVDGCGGSAVGLAETLAGWDCFADSSLYDGVALPFLKRAQLAAADLARAGVAGFDDLGALTMFADNLVPHVLRLDGLLWFDPGLVERVEREQLIEHGSPEEVEIRACAVHAVELIVAASPFPATTAAAVDQVLWNRGQGPFYKGRPRHRSRSTAY